MKIETSLNNLTKRRDKLEKEMFETILSVLRKVYDHEMTWGRGYRFIIKLIELYKKIL